MTTPQLLTAIASAAKEKNLSGYALAKITRLDARHIYRVLNNEHSPSLDTVLKLCEAVGLRLEIFNLGEMPAKTNIMANHCPLHLISRFKETFPNHTPICDSKGELTCIWFDWEDKKERGGITDAMFDLFDSFIPPCPTCGSEGTNALNQECLSCEKG
jgi:transcriptional regulator with XRE-family HTH domain